MKRNSGAYSTDEMYRRERAEREKDTHPDGADAARERMIQRMQPEPYKPKAHYLQRDETRKIGGNQHENH